MGDLIKNALKALRERELASARDQKSAANSKGQEKPAETFDWGTSANDALRVGTVTQYR